MKIEIWSDFVCPYCYVGKRQLEEALANFPYKDFVTLKYKSYQLDPAAEDIPGKTFNETFYTLNGMPIEQLEALNKTLTQQAQTVSLPLQLDTVKYANTFDAHRLFHYAEQKDKGEELTERFQQAFFTESVLLSDENTLVGLAGEVGLVKPEVSAILQSKKYSRKVKEDRLIAAEMGLQEIPFFVFNEKHAISGVHTVELFSRVLEKVWEGEGGERNQQRRMKAKTYYCTEDGCTEE